jgi:membrane protein
LAAAYGQSKAGSYAAALAFNAFMTMFPLILGLLAIVGLVIQDPGTQERLQNIITGIFPADAHDQLTQAIKGVKKSAGVLGLISIAGLIWGGTSFFASMEFSLTQIFGTRQRRMLRQRLMGAVMMLVFLAALLLTAGANSLAGLPFALGQAAGFIVGTVVLIGLLLLIYRFVPNRSFKLAQIWPGAVFAGILIEILSLVFPIYARVAHGFNTYGQQFALFFLLATWLYLLSQLLLLGAVFNRMRLGPPTEEGMVPEPGDRGEVPPAPAEAIDEQREQVGAPARASSSGEASSSDSRQEAGGQGAGRETERPVASRPDPASARAETSVGKPRQAVFGIVGFAIGLLARRRAPKAASRNPR